MSDEVDAAISELYRWIATTLQRAIAALVIAAAIVVGIMCGIKILRACATPMADASQMESLAAAKAATDEMR